MSTFRYIASRYKVIDLIGKGGMGEVYLCIDQENGERRAVKILHRDEPELRGILTREFLILQRSPHPYIVKVYDIGVHENRPYITMEYVEGRPLRRHLKLFAGGDVGEIARLMTHLLLVVGYLHRLGIVHRDIKESNIVVQVNARGPDHLTLLGFGLATRTGVHGAAGTLDYIAPELLSPGDFLAPGDKPDHRADLYSVGVLFFRLLSDGIYPTGSAQPLASVAEAVAAVRRGFTCSVRDFAPKAPRSFDALIASLLAANPRSRMQSAGEALEAILQEYPSFEFECVTPPPTNLALPFLDTSGVLKTASRLHAENRKLLVEIRGAARHGKTRLLEQELSREIGALGSEYVYSSYAQGGKSPRHPLDALRARVLALYPDERERLAADFPLVFTGGTVASPNSTRHLEEELWHLFATVTGERPLWLSIDDIQWGDQSLTAILGAWLRPHPADRPVQPICLVVGRQMESIPAFDDHINSARTATASPDPFVLSAFDSEHIRRYLNAAGKWRAEDVRLVLDVLDGGGSVPPGDVEACLMMLQSQQAIRVDSGRWEVVPKELVRFKRQQSTPSGSPRRRHLQLDLPSSSILQVLAVMHPRLVTRDLAQRLAQIRPSVADKAIEILVQHGLVSLVATRCRITEASARTEVYESIPQAIRQTLHMKAAKALQETEEGGNDLAQIARHYRLSGDSDLGVEWSLKAGYAALDAGRALEAVEHLDAAVDLFDNLHAPRNAEHGRALLLAARARLLAFGADDLDATKRLIERAAALAGLDDPLLRADVAVLQAQATRLEWRHLRAESPVDVDALMACLRQRLDELPESTDSSVTRARLLHELGLAVRRRGEHKAAVPYLEEAAKLADTLGLPEAVSILIDLGYCYLRANLVEQAAGLAETAIRRCSTNVPRSTLVNAQALSAETRIYQNDGVGAIRAYAKAVSSCQSPLVTAGQRARVQQQYADLLAEAACGAKGLAVISRALSEYTSGGSIQERSRFTEAKCHALLGRLSVARSSLTHVLAFAETRSSNPSGRDLAFEARYWLFSVEADLGIDITQRVLDFLPTDDSGIQNGIHYSVSGLMLSAAGLAAARAALAARRRGDPVGPSQRALRRLLKRASDLNLESIELDVLGDVSLAIDQKPPATDVITTIANVRALPLDRYRLYAAHGAALSSLLRGNPQAALQFAGECIAVLDRKRIDPAMLRLSSFALYIWALVDLGRFNAAARWKLTLLKGIRSLRPFLSDDDLAQLQSVPFWADARRQTTTPTQGSLHA